MISKKYYTSAIHTIFYHLFTFYVYYVIINLVSGIVSKTKGQHNGYCDEKNAHSNDDSQEICFEQLP